MDERDQKTAGALSEEEHVRQLLEMAGPRPAIPQEDLDAIAAAARSAWQTEIRRRAVVPGPAPRRPLRTLLALAAAVIVAVGLAWWWVSRAPRGPASVPPTVAWVEAVTGPVQLGTNTDEARTITTGEPIPLGAALRSGDGRAALRLAGGATVRLDVESRLRFASATVLDLERGALYVDTGSGPHRGPIEVRTPLGTARDIGTRFALHVVGPDKTLLVRVRDGAVLTEQRGRTYNTQAGEELILHHDGRAERREIPGYGADWEWVLAASPGFDIEGRTLGEFLAWTSRETGWKIVFADAGLADSAGEIVLHGGIGELRPDQAPFAVLPGAGLEGEIEDGTLIVRRRR
jgi:ferric-dicitrate binding protein FerR (iron transport regulator)